MRRRENVPCRSRRAGTLPADLRSTQSLHKRRLGAASIMYGVNPKSDPQTQDPAGGPTQSPLIVQHQARVASCTIPGTAWKRLG